MRAVSNWRSITFSGSDVRCGSANEVNSAFRHKGVRTFTALVWLRLELTLTLTLTLTVKLRHPREATVRSICIYVFAVRYPELYKSNILTVSCSSISLLPNQNIF